MKPSALSIKDTDDGLLALRFKLIDTFSGMA